MINSNGISYLGFRNFENTNISTKRTGPVVLMLFLCLPFVNKFTIIDKKEIFIYYGQLNKLYSLSSESIVPLLSKQSNWGLFSALKISHMLTQNLTCHCRKIEFSCLGKVGRQRTSGHFLLEKILNFLFSKF